MNKIEMVDLKGQYKQIKAEIDTAIIACVESAEFINGKMVHQFADNLGKYTGAKYVIPCANGTDALQIAMMALGLKVGDEVIVPTFTYVATAEVIALLGLTPVWVDVNPDTFNIDCGKIEAAITSKTKAIVPVHLYGQCADMEQIMTIADKHNIYVIEDTAQAIGAEYTFLDGHKKMAGTIGTIGCTSFFPSKNLGCYGDGGAMFTNDDRLGKYIKMIANHGQEKKYHHDTIGVNSRLDTLQAAILDVKLNYLTRYSEARSAAASVYDELLKEVNQLQIPVRNKQSTHVFHQYTLKVSDGKRDELKKYLEAKGIPTMIYYPIPMHLQKAYYSDVYPKGSFPIAESLTECVLSLPMHTELNRETQEYIINEIKSFYK
ncbi:Pleiotropic regulatory protein [Bacteroidetes bacterium UKL13-3]|jgi:dTDP-4-amino-4,6-dideoxygalactose transaminase|nr:Pleiotropic regulatory protein [Bacteroidetes bacterium UKL13-3]HCP94807.1 transcriptional regulator [Bacteroidota bacterium]